MKQHIRTFAGAGWALFIASFGPAQGNQGTPPEADRRAILSMAGEYHVDFHFTETVPLQPGYQLREEYREDAIEKVFVIEDSGDRIALQHILLTGNGSRVVKHWKQIWTWQDTRITEFQGREKWKVTDRSPETVRGTWSQLVTQVDDSPRYESYGRWRHEGGYSRWQSGPTNRPLPRREHTKRDDYEVLLAINEHALTPYGWVHYQDNLKQVLDEDGSVRHYLAREKGLNFYDLTEDEDFGPALAYWEETRDFWKKVAAFWEGTQQKRSEFGIRKEVDGKSLVKATFDMADEIQAGKRETPSREEVESLITPYLE